MGMSLRNFRTRTNNQDEREDEGVRKMGEGREEGEERETYKFINILIFRAIKSWFM